MGRPNKGLRLTWRKGIGYARFTHAGREYYLSTGSGDPVRAESEARRLFNTVTGGRHARPASTRDLIGADLDVLWAEWLASEEGSLDVETVRTYRTIYCGKHWPAHYKTLTDMASRVARQRYRTERLKAALAKTVKKEVWAQDKFLRWCVTSELLDEDSLPPRLIWAKGAVGTRTGKQREHAKELTPEEVQRFLAELPAWREVGKRAISRKPFPVRDRYVFAYETGLRPETLCLLTWGDLTEMYASLRIRNEADKIRYGRVIPLSAAAQGALRRVHSGRLGRGLSISLYAPIFGRHESYKTIAKAAKAAGLEGVAPYDLRHARATHLADAGAAITGIGYLVGHKQATTTNRYLHQSEKAAQAALEKAQGDDNGRSDQNVAAGRLVERGDRRNPGRGGRQHGSGGDPEPLQSAGGLREGARGDDRHDARRDAPANRDGAAGDGVIRTEFRGSPVYHATNQGDRRGSNPRHLEPQGTGQAPAHRENKASGRIHTGHETDQDRLAQVGTGPNPHMCCLGPTGCGKAAIIGQRDIWARGGVALFCAEHWRFFEGHRPAPPAWVHEATANLYELLGGAS